MQRPWYVGLFQDARTVREVGDLSVGARRAERGRLSSDAYRPCILLAERNPPLNSHT